MANILSRIQEIAQKEGITIGLLERVIGASKGVLSRAISNGTDIQSKWLGILVENYPHYSTRWLLTGEGPMLRDSKSPEETTVESHPHSPPLISSAEESIIYKMYTDEREERHHVQKEKEELLQRIAVLEERIEKCESSVLPVEAVSSAKSSLRKRSATSAGVRSNE